MIEDVRSLMLRDHVVLAAFSLVLLGPGTFGVSLVDRAPDRARTGLARSSSLSADSTTSRDGG